MNKHAEAGITPPRHPRVASRRSFVVLGGGNGVGLGTGYLVALELSE